MTMTLTKKFRDLLCDQENKPSIHGSEEDLRILETLLQELQQLERKVSDTGLTDVKGNIVREGDSILLTVRYGNEFAVLKGQVVLRFGCFGVNLDEKQEKSAEKFARIETNFIALFEANYGIEVL